MTFAAGALIGIWALLGGAQDDKTFQPAIKKFQDDFYRLGAKDDEKINAVETLSAYRHASIVKVLAPLMTEGSLAVRVKTARALGSFGGVESAGKELLSALQSTSNGGKKASAVRIEALRALGQLRYKPAATEIVRNVDDKEVWVAKAAIDASAQVRMAEAIEPLIKALRRIEGREGDGMISINPFAELFPDLQLKADPREKAKRPSERELLRGPLNVALQATTRQTHGNAKDWESWWGKNKTSFKVAD